MLFRSVAGFFGTPQMNFFDAELLVEEGQYVAKLYDARFVLPESAQSLLKSRKQQTGTITLGIRPEHIDLVANGTANSIQGRVDVSELMGSEMHLHVDIRGKDAVLRVPTPEKPEEFYVDGGHAREISFTFSPSRAHYFCKETGQNLLAE